MSMKPAVSPLAPKTTPTLPRNGKGDGGMKEEWARAIKENKPDIATNIARQWVDVEKVDIFMDVLNSGVALAVNNLVREKNSIMINTGAASSDLTNAQ